MRGPTPDNTDRSADERKLWWLQMRDEGKKIAAIAKIDGNTSAAYVSAALNRIKRDLSESEGKAI